MRIATWNLQRGPTRAARQAQDSVLRDLQADVLVLTEPGPAYQDGPGVVTSPPGRPDRNGDEAWVAIVGASAEPVAIDVPFERMAVAARASVNGVPLAIEAASPTT